MEEAGLVAFLFPFIINGVASNSSYFLKVFVWLSLKIETSMQVRLRWGKIINHPMN